MKFCMKCMAQYGDDFNICPSCGFREGTLPSDSRCIEPGEILGERYIVGMPLSVDGWLIRYIGWDALTERTVKINEYFPTRYAVRNLGETALRVIKQEPFYRCLSALMKNARLLSETRLPDNVSPVYESFEKNGTAYIITGYAHGTPLTEYIKNNAPLKAEDAERLFLPMLRSLDKLHENGFVSGGFSPESFSVSDDGKLIFSDYIGNLFYHISDSPDDVKPCGDDRYFPCERIPCTDTVRLSPENDVFSAALIIYELLGAELPDGKRRMEVYAQKHRDILKKPSSYGAKIEKSKENALINAAAVEVGSRTSDMETFIRELTSDKQVPIKSQKDKGIPLWAKIAVPAAAVVLIVAAVLVIPMFTAKNSTESSARADSPEIVRCPSDGQTVVPSVTELSLDDAAAELKRSGLLLEVEGKTVDDGRSENTVLSQSVDKGAVVGVNSVVGVTVSTLSHTFSMPNLIGMNINNCTDILDELGVRYTIAYEFSDSVGSDCVISQSVAPYTKTAATQPLSLIVSRGAEEPPSQRFTEVADFKGQPYEETVTRAAQSHTPVEVTGRVYDDTLPEGTVVEQYPPAGETPAPDEPVKLVVTTAAETVIVPDVTLFNRDLAQRILQYYGLTAEFSEQPDDSVSQGLIVSQEPSADSEVGSGTAVSLIVSAGKEELEMPDVVGMDREEAAECLQTAGLPYAVTYDSDAEKPEGEILRQSIAAGESVKKGTEVLITVSTGKAIAPIPDIVGLDWRDADRAVTEAGFNLLVYVDDERFPHSDGKVYAQGPRAGVYAERGSDIVVLLDGEAAPDDESGPPAIALSAESVSVGVGEEFDLEIDTRGVTDLKLVNYELSAPDVIEVTKIDTETLTMTFRAVSAGTVDITISCGELEKVCRVTVS